MKKIIMIQMQGCPYCAQAHRAIDEIKKSDEKFSKAEIECIDENLQPQLAVKFENDYYYVPSMFVDGKKIYEAHPGETYSECLQHVKSVFQAATENN